jgi:hypothetical protein
MSCYNSVTVNAPVDQVWQTLRKFHDMSWGDIQVEAVGEAGETEIGAKRILNGAFHETLRTFDDEERTFSYSIDDGPDAVSKDNVQGYIGEVRVFPVTDEDSTFVLWTSKWDSSGGGVQEFCDPIYQTLLGALKSHFA